jgi:hypothetical protein
MNADTLDAPQRAGLIFDCERCGKPIEFAAALLFSPPNAEMVRKHHVCGECYEIIINDFRTIKQKGL